MDRGEIERRGVRGLEVGLDERLGVHGEAPIPPRPEKGQQRDSDESEAADRGPRQRMEMVAREDPAAEERGGDRSGSDQRPSARPQLGGRFSCPRLAGRGGSRL